VADELTRQPPLLRRRAFLAGAFSLAVGLPACRTTRLEGQVDLGGDRTAFGFRKLPLVDGQALETAGPTGGLADLITPIELTEPGRFPTRPDRALPLTLSADTIGVADAPIRPVGVDGDGYFDVPEREEVGWYSFGPTPGEGGSSVLAAHISTDGKPGVFRDLRDLDTGHELSVTFDDGSTESFVVLGLVQYSKEVLPIEKLFDRSGPPSMVLITCGGTFNPQLESYDDNIIVYTIKA